MHKLHDSGVISIIVVYIMYYSPITRCVGKSRKLNQEWHLALSKEAGNIHKHVGIPKSETLF
jgi:hypothetical protein